MWILSLLAAAALPAPEALAQEDLLGELKTVASVRFIGRHRVSARELRSVMKTRAPSAWPWHERPLLRPDFIRSDTLAIRDRYRLHGYLDASVGAVLSSSRDSTAMDVTYLIHEGPQSRVAEVTFRNVFSYPQEELRRKLLTRRGEPFDPYVLQLDTLKISELYQERGFRPNVSAVARRGEGPDSLRVSVEFEVDEGNRYKVGDVFVHFQGETKVDELLVRRELLLHPGDYYRRIYMVRSWERLYDTGLFSQVQISPIVDSTRSKMDIDIGVRPRKPRWIDAGVGSGSSERYRATGEWGHRNLLGRGLQGALGARIAFDGPGHFLLAHTEVSLLSPWMLGRRIRGVATPFYERSDDRTDSRWLLSQDSRGIKFELRRELNRFSSISLTQNNLWASLRYTARETIPQATLDTLISRFNTHSIGLSGTWDYRDNPLNATRGSVHSITGDLVGGPLRGTSSFRKLQIASAWYIPRSNGWVLGVRVRAGVIEPVGEARAYSIEAEVDSVVARVPPGDRFTVGGVNSVRGYGEGKIPPSGGLAMIQANAEVRIPVIGPFGLEIYMDAGNAWARPSYVQLRQFAPRISDAPMGANDVRYVIGIGPRLNLPIGPVRFDLTWSLRPDVIDGKTRWLRAEKQFAIGPSF